MQWFGMGAYVKPATEPMHNLDPEQCENAIIAEDSDLVSTEQEEQEKGGNTQPKEVRK